MLGLSVDTAQVLCNSERWVNTDRLAERWFQDPEKVAESAGIFVDETGSFSSSSSCSSSTPAAAAAEAAPSFECPVCGESKGAADGFSLACNHLVCTECWTQGLSSYVVSAESLRTTCFNNCKVVVPPSVFERFLPPELLDAVLKLGAELARCIHQTSELLRDHF